MGATAFQLLRERCGLSRREAAGLLGVRDDTIKSWDLGRREAAAGAVAELRALYARQWAAVEATLDALRREAEVGAVVELGLARDDAEARALGWPCVGAHAAILGAVVAEAEREVRVVPRGSTPATAAAGLARA